MAIDGKLRGCDLVKRKVVDVMASGQIKERASILQSKTKKPVRFEISEGTRASVDKGMEGELMVGSEYLWPSRCHERWHISKRQCLWDPFDATDQSYPDRQEDGLPTGCAAFARPHKMDSTVRYLGLELEDALNIAESIEI